METHFFRRLARRLAEALPGFWIRKLHGPAPDVLVLSLDSPGQRRFLTFRHGRRDPWLFLAESAPPNPPSPTAAVMWLRRRLQARRIVEVRQDWPRRRLALRLAQSQAEDRDAAEGWMILDLRHGPSFCLSLDDPPDAWLITPQTDAPPAADPWPAPDSHPAWPSLDEARADASADASGAGDVWKRHPVLSPPLRRLLQALDRDTAAHVYPVIQAGADGASYLYDGATPLAWADPTRPDAPRVFMDALEAAAVAGVEQLFPEIVAAQRREETAAQSARRKKQHRVLKAMAREEERLRELLGQREEGLLLQANLHALPGQEKHRRVTVSDPDGQPRVLTLDPRLTVVENMARRFRQAAKADRGLAITQARREALLAEMAAPAETSSAPPSSAGSPGKPSRGKGKQDNPDRQGRQGRQGRQDGQDGQGKAEAFREFRSSDGFRILQGRNARANHRLVTRVARPFDFWLHAADGPGSHVLVQRDHAGQEPPRRTLEEAAILAALRSWQAGEAKCRVMLALAKHVSPIKGGAPGQVRVEKVLEEIVTAMEADLEARLEGNAATPDSTRAR